MPDETRTPLQKVVVPRNSFIKAQIVFTLLLGILPYIPYANGRLFHGLPSEAQWQSRGANHGPWWTVHPLDYWIVLPMLLLLGLPVLTFTFYLLTSVHQKRSMILGQSLGLCGLQFGLFILQMCTVFWVIN